MRFLAASTRKDLTRILRDPVGLIAWVALPAIVCSLLALISGGGGPLPRGTLLIVDQDHSLLSNFLRSAFDRQPLSDMIQTETADYAPARKRIDAGNASALLVIPSGFGRDFLERKPVDLTLLTNPSQRIVPSVIREVLSLLTDGGFYIQRVLGSNLGNFVQRDPSDAAVQRNSVLINHLAREASVYVFPPLIHLQTHVIARKKEQQSIVALFFPGMLVLAIFGLAQSASQDIWVERKLGTLRRIRATPRPLFTFLLAKILSLAILCAGIAVAGLLLARYVLHSATNNFVVAALWIAGSGVMLYLIACILQLLASEERAGIMLNAFVLFVFAMAGGTFFPFELMPDWLARFGRLTPNGWAVAQFKQLIAGPLHPASDGLAFALLAVLIGAGLTLLVPLARRWSV